MNDPARDPFEDRLRERLERLTLAIPVDPPAMSARTDRAGAPWRARSWRAIALTAALVALVSLGTAAVLLEIGHPSTSTSAFAAGEPLHCSGVDQLSPRDAAAWLADRGMEVRWQVEERAQRTFDHTAGPPDRGAIIDALALPDGTLLVLVDAGRDAPLPPKPCP